MGRWKVVAEPEGKNPGVLKKAADAVKAATPGVSSDADTGNVGGMIIYLQDTGSSSKQEVSRVAWVRRNSKNPKVSFEKQLGIEVAKAQKAAEVMNSLASDGELQ